MRLSEIDVECGINFELRRFDYCRMKILMRAKVNFISGSINKRSGRYDEGVRYRVAGATSRTRLLVEEAVIAA